MFRATVKGRCFFQLMQCVSLPKIVLIRHFIPVSWWSCSSNQSWPIPVPPCWMFIKTYMWFECWGVFYQLQVSMGPVLLPLSHPSPTSLFSFKCYSHRSQLKTWDVLTQLFQLSFFDNFSNFKSVFSHWRVLESLVINNDSGGVSRKAK